MRIMRTVAVAGVTVVAVSGIAGTILPSGNRTSSEIAAHQQQAWAENERQRVEEENVKLSGGPNQAEGSGAADGAGDVDADATAAADRSRADDAAEGVVDALVRR